MTRRRQTPKPVPLTPTHRRDWRTFWRRCTCGLTSPCVDRLVPATPRPFPPRTATATHPPAGSAEERSPRYPALIEYLATVPFPVHGPFLVHGPFPVHWGLAALRMVPTEPSPSPDSPEPSLPCAPAAHPGGSGALGGPGSRPCPGSRAGAAPYSDPPGAVDRPPPAAPQPHGHTPDARTVAGDGRNNADHASGGQKKDGSPRKRPKAADGRSNSIESAVGTDGRAASGAADRAGGLSRR